MLTVDIKKKLHDYTLELNLEHREGCLGILGPSGCGKSISLKSIAGLIPPDEGLIRLDEKTFYSSETHVNLRPQLRKTGYLFQNYALFPNMTVKGNVASGLSRKDKNFKELRSEYIHRFQLDGLENYYPAQLSGGQQQRTALARILASRPELLLLDEPFSAMDAVLKETLRLELFQVLKDYRGLSVLVTHDKDEVYQLCDSLIVMEPGRVLCSGPTKEIFRNPGNCHAALQTGCKNISPIRRLSSHRLLAVSWNLVLTASKAIPDTVTAAGIYPHALIPLTESDAAFLEGRDDANLIPLIEPGSSSLPFEWEYRLRNGLCWTVTKNSSETSPPPLPAMLRVRPEDVLLLS